MLDRRVIARALLLLSCALSPGAGSAGSAGEIPRVGECLPAFQIRDLLGQLHSTTELTGRHTLVLAMTETGAEEAMRAWGKAADARLPEGTHRVTLVILQLAFFIPQDLARARARPQTERRLWADTWLDAHRDPHDASLESSELPYVFALDESGTIAAEAHARVDDASAEAIWSALRARP